MNRVKCDHCGSEVNKEDAVPCTWKKYNLTWYYCGKCEEEVFDGKIKTKINNKEVVEKLKLCDNSKSFLISDKR